MRTGLLLILAAASLVLAPRAAAQEGAQRQETGAAAEARWARYTYPGEEFSAELPGMPSVYNGLRGVNDSWRMTERVRTFSLYSGGVIYFVVAYDRPHSSESLDFFAAHLRGAWGLSPKGSLKLGDFEGKAYNVAGTQRGRIVYDLHGEGRVFRAKNHAYLALALSNEQGRPEVERFLNSLVLGESPAGERVAAEEPVPRFVPPNRPPGPPPGGVIGPGRGGADDEPAGGAEERLKLVGRGGAATTPQGDGPFSGRDVERRALIVYKPEPPYTEEARKARVNGTIRLRAVLSSTGRVTGTEAITWLPNGLTESAIRTALQMRFFPAEVGGHPVSQYVILEYNFNVY